MDKKTKDIILLTSLLFIILNVLIFNLYLSKRFVLVKESRVKYVEKKKRIEKYIEDEKKLPAYQKEVNKLKEGSIEILNMTSYNIDTPQLIYDFYNYCKKYGARGESITFKIDPRTGMDLIEKSNSKEKVLKFRIELNAVANKNVVDNFIDNFDKITKRTLALEEIDITSSGEQEKLNISFSQYILFDGEGHELPDSYSFYDVQIGFDSIAKMLK